MNKPRFRKKVFPNAQPSKHGAPKPFASALGGAKAVRYAVAKQGAWKAATAKAPAKTPGPSPIPKKDPNAFPMRINKYIALQGLATRREADDLVARKKVLLNGRIAILGDKVMSKDDVVEVTHHGKAATYVYYAYNKPRGIATDRTLKGKSILQTVNFGAGAAEKDLFPLAGLDPNAEGLVILTNDRRTIDRITNPRHPHTKEYVIHTLGDLRGNFKEKIEAGVFINGTTIQSTVEIRDPRTFILTTTDNGNHVRQMCSTHFAEIQSLKRTAVMNVRMGPLASNGYRKIEEEELAEFLRELGL